MTYVHAMEIWSAPMRFLILAFTFSFLGSSAATAQQRLQIVGHRGLIHHAPENTLAGSAACLSLRLGFEIDVRRTKDGALVCVHDGTLDRTTDGKGNVADFSLAELQKLDAGRRFHPEFAGEKIPLLSEIFALLAAQGDGALLALDVKDEDLEADILGLIHTHKVSERIVCIGLTIEQATLRKKLRAGDKKLGIAALAQTEKDLEKALEDPAANWIYVRFVPSAEQVARIHKQGKRVFIAGVTVAGKNDENWMRCRDAGVDALLTDFPLECRKILK